MSADNKVIARRFYEEVWNRGNMTAADEILADAEGVKQYVAAFRAAFPDIQHKVEELIAERNKVVARFTARGTHRGKWQGVAATGRPISYTGITIFQFSGSQIVRHHTEWDSLGLLKHIGLVP